MATFAVAGDIVYLVESSYDNRENWLGDYITRLDLVTGRKSDYISLDDMQRQFGIISPSLWVN
jgi:hypothetical protein